MNSNIIDSCNRLQDSEKNMVLDAVAMFEKETGNEFSVMIVDSVDDKLYQKHARLMRKEHTHNIEKSLILVISINDRHAELATSYSLSELFTDGFTKNLLVTHFVPDMREGLLGVAIVKVVAECQKQVKLQWWMVQSSSTVMKKRMFFNTVKVLIAPVVLLMSMILFMVLWNFRCPECLSWFSLSKSTGVYEYSATEQNTSIMRCSKCKYVKSLTSNNRKSVEYNKNNTNNWENDRSNFHDNSSQSTYESPSYDDNSSDGPSGSSSDWSSSGSDNNDGGGGADW